MTDIQWSDGFNVGIAEVDGQHKKLVEMLNALSAAVAERSGREQLGPIIGQLKDYASYHFSTEEKLMQRHGYPGHAAHKAEHRMFLEKVLAHEALVADGSASAYDLWVFLRSWLLDHIMGVDLEMGRFLQENGVS